MIFISFHVVIKSANFQLIHYIHNPLEHEEISIKNSRFTTSSIIHMINTLSSNDLSSSVKNKLLRNFVYERTTGQRDDKNVISVYTLNLGQSEDLCRRIQTHRLAIHKRSNNPFLSFLILQDTC